MPVALRRLSPRAGGMRSGCDEGFGDPIRQRTSSIGAQRANVDLKRGSCSEAPAILAIAARSATSFCSTRKRRTNIAGMVARRESSTTADALTVAPSSTPPPRWAATWIALSSERSTAARQSATVVLQPECRRCKRTNAAGRCPAPASCLQEGRAKIIEWPSQVQHQRRSRRISWVHRTADS